jgi:ubiquinone/menaquinone biosynthesis C-methylase UbiE
MPGANLYNFDRVAEIYDRTRGLPPHVETAVARGLAELVGHVAGAGVLEVGAGSGRIAVPLAREGVRVTGIDISPRMLGLLRAKDRGIAVALAEAGRLPFRSQAFDAALFVHILHLVPDVPATLAEAARCVRPGGMLLSCRSDHGTNPLRKASEEVDALLVELMGRPFRRRRRESNDDAVRAATGPAARFETATLATWSEQECGRDYLADLEERVHSNTWEIPDGALAAALPRAREIVARHCGGLDVPHPVEMRFVAQVAHLPAAAVPG